MREFFEKTLILTVFALAARLPLAFRRPLARLISALIWHLRLDMRKATEINLALCFPHLSANEQKQLAKQSVFHTVMVALEIPVVWTQAPSKSLAQITAVEGKALLDQAQEQGKGVIVIAPHLGNWEYLGLFLGHYYQAVSLYQPPKRAWLEQVTRKGREQTGAKLVPTNKKGVLAILKALKAGGVTGILPDQLPERDSGTAFAAFFGQVTPTMTLIPSLLQRGNVVAVAGFAQRLDDGNFKIIFQAAPESIYDADETVAATALNQAVEQLVALAPAQYQWEYKRFRRGDNNQRRRLYGE
jgi:Kdo2-lipid IVA lauroyltransferase/acyltransferase